MLQQNYEAERQLHFQSYILGGQGGCYNIVRRVHNIINIQEETLDTYLLP